jgi:hypothetical protein
MLTRGSWRTLVGGELGGDRHGPRSGRRATPGGIWIGQRLQHPLAPDLGRPDDQTVCRGRIHLSTSSAPWSMPTLFLSSDTL